MEQPANAPYGSYRDQNHASGTTLSSSPTMLSDDLVQLVRKRLKKEDLFSILSDLETMGIDEQRLQMLADQFQTKKKLGEKILQPQGASSSIYAGIFNHTWLAILLLLAFNILSFISTGFMSSNLGDAGQASMLSLILAAILRSILFIAESYLLCLVINFESHNNAKFTHTLWYFNYVTLMLFFMNFFIYGLGLLHTELGYMILYFSVFILSIPFFIFFFEQNFFHSTVIAFLFLFLNGAFYFILHFLNAQMFGERVLVMFLSVL